MFKRNRRKESHPSVGNLLDPETSAQLPTQALNSPFDALSKRLERVKLAARPKSTPSATPSLGQSGLPARESNPLGLSVVHEPNTEPLLDIIFVHGLGGTSRTTWCHNRDPALFWPGEWLPLEPDIQKARILSFGYNAHFAAPGPAIATGLEDLALGERPIVFIAHSMGGLVVKKAYIFGQNDIEYMQIVSSIHAILFLATPHRGTHLAESLNRVLSISVFNHSPKQYVAELSKASPALEDINEQFQHIAPKLQIFSFFETLFTNIGPKKLLILEKSSSVLGYPAEISKCLNADHHQVCKYESKQDPNYITVRNTLKTVVSKLHTISCTTAETQLEEQMKLLEVRLSVINAPIEDLNFFQSRWTPGTCECVLSNPTYMDWKNGGADSRILWLYGLPAAGKSIMSSFSNSLLFGESCVRTRGLDITFHNSDTALFLGSADRGIRRAFLTSSDPIWTTVDEKLLLEETPLNRTVINAPSSITFSPDAERIAVTYRGFPLCVWKVDRAKLVGRCRRNPNNPKNLWSPAECVVWHPFSGELLGIYPSGYIFKWHPYSGAHREVHTSASVVACDPKGTYFATASSRGVIKIFTFDDFILIYQLTCDEGSIALSFSPDGKQLYDLRSHSCTIWDPNVLQRPRVANQNKEFDDEEIEQDITNTVAIAETTSYTKDTISAVAIHPGGIFCLLGYESGAVTIIDLTSPGHAVHLFLSPSLSLVDHLYWGSDGKHIAYKDLSGTLIVMSAIQSTIDGSWIVSSNFQIKPEIEIGGVQQLILSPDAKILLVSGHTSASTYIVNQYPGSQAIHCGSADSRWLQHPHNPTLLLAVSIDRVRLYQWLDLALDSEFEIVTETNTSQLSDTGGRVSLEATEISRLSLTADGSRMLLQSKTASRAKENSQRAIFLNTKDFDMKETMQSEPHKETVLATTLPQSLNHQIEIPLGILSKNRFVFLDKNFTMCSVRLDEAGVHEASLKEHFFLPRDWLRRECLKLCSLLPDGRFLIPYNGEVAIIRSSLMFEW